MAPDRLMFATASPRSPGPVIDGALSDPVVATRLDRAERELRVQFTRIAQLQAQLDLMTAALRRFVLNFPSRVGPLML